jgi:hypothetical protein
VIYIDSNQGRIGPFWWVNGIHSKIEMYNATYKGSVHYVWRPGVFGLDQILPVKIFHAPFFCYRLISQEV